ncbi:methyltransferase domain-containing protein [Desulfovibrio inopinatus]|uniref:methyltransferase domain-containing protein n=1 Tax=Desulfovibrio inopinatus TaxID=102109 RepID=UPI0004179851|nr:methyltransferase domain-containing protein [Desulfovibrio inopinatus]
MPYSTHSIGRAFGRAKAYQDYAAVQQEAAHTLSHIAAAQCVKPPRRILELGCGTGLLTEHIQRRWPDAEILVTDLSPAMVMRCRDKHRQPQTTFAVMDAQLPACRVGFDLIVSSLALHWTADLCQTGNRLLQLLEPDGCIALSLPGIETFHQWRDILSTMERTPGFAPFFSRQDMINFWGNQVSSVHENRLDIVYPSGQDFLRTLKGLGAATPRPGYTPLPPQKLRQALTQLPTGPDNTGVTLTWHLLYATLKKDSASS